LRHSLFLQRFSAFAAPAHVENGMTAASMPQGTKKARSLESALYVRADSF
jgi:hypothetical protein